MRSNTKEDWSNALFVQRAELFLPQLESLIKQSTKEVNGLLKIFNQFSIRKGAKILDFSCGIGRHSVILAEKGYEVVGFDPSPLYIDRAFEYARQRNLSSKKVRFIIGKVNKAFQIMSKEQENNFQVIIIMNNTFGFSSEENDINNLRQLKKLASPGCILILETENRDCTIRNFQNYLNFESREIEIQEEWKMDLEKSVANSRSKFYRKLKNGAGLQLELDIQTSLRLYSLHELKSLIKRSGWNCIGVYGSIVNLTAPTIDSKQLVTVNAFMR